MDPAIESHFIAYFKLPVWNMARQRLRSRDWAEDALQETLMRVLRYFRSGKGLDTPERLPAFVLSFCRNITREMLKDLSRSRQVNELNADPVDSRVDLEFEVVSMEQREMVHTILSGLGEKDGKLLRALLEGAEKEELCERLGVTSNYLRVLLFRARKQFQRAYLKHRPKGVGSTKR